MERRSDIERLLGFATHAVSIAGELVTVAERGVGVLERVMTALGPPAPPRRRPATKRATAATAKKRAPKRTR